MKSTVSKSIDCSTSTSEMAADPIHIEPGFRALLERHGLTDFAAMVGAPTGRPTSRHRTRSTAPLSLDDNGRVRTFFLKRVDRVPIKHILADMVRGRVPIAQPVREFRAAQRLHERGIGAMRPVAWGQRTWCGLPRQAFVLVEAVPTPHTLKAIWTRLLADGPRSGPTVGDRHSLATALGSFVRSLHAADFSYPDLVSKHIYVRSKPPRLHESSWEFFLIDVERLTSTRGGNEHPRQLRRLMASLAPLPLSTTDLLRFATGYLTHAPDDWTDRKRALQREFAWAGRLVLRLQRGAARLPRWPLDLLAQADEQFVRIGRVTVNERYINLLQQNGLGSFRAVLDYRAGRALQKPGLPMWRSRDRVDLIDAAGATHTVYLKRYRQPSIGQQIRRCLTAQRSHGTAWWEWQQIRTLLAAGIPTLMPVAFGEKMRGWSERCSFLISESVPGQSLERWVPQTLSPMETSGQAYAQQRHMRVAVVDELARLTHAFHRAGFVHRDLYLSHVFLSGDSSGRPALRLIDLARAFRPRWRRARWIVKDLAALNLSAPATHISQTDRFRFLKRYLGCARLDRRARSLIRRVVAKTERMARHLRSPHGPTVSDLPVSHAKAASVP